MARTKFQIGDKVRFLTTNSGWSYLKGQTGTVKEIEPSSEGRALYKVVYKHAMTGKEKWSYFTSKDLEKVESGTGFDPSEFVNNPINNVEEEPSVEPKKNKENWSSWDDFCDKFKGGLFKD